MKFNNFVALLLVFIIVSGCSTPNSTVNTFSKKDFNSELAETITPPGSGSTNWPSASFFTLSQSVINKNQGFDITYHVIGIATIVISGVIEREIQSYGSGVFNWDGKDKNGKYVNSGVYEVRVVEKLPNNYLHGGLYRPVPYSDPQAQNNSTELSHFFVVKDELPESLPEGTEFFETSDFINIVNYTNQLNVSTNNINDLYAKTKQLEIYKEQKISLLARPAPNNTKIAQINNEIANLESSVNSLASAVMINVSDLNNRKQTLANHINTITKEQYITYNPNDKPDSVGSYFDITYYLDLDINNLLSDGVEFYAPDENDLDQSNLKKAWEIDSEQLELLDPTNIFDATKTLSEEIQAAKNLITDYITPSNTNDIYQNPEAIETLHTLLNQIKDHSTLLSSRAKKYSDDYSTNAQKIRLTDALKAYIFLQLAEVDNQLESGDSLTLQSLKNIFDDNSFSIKLNDNNYFSRFRGLPSQEAINQVISQYGPLAVKYFNKPLFDQEKATIKFYGYTQDQWNALKAQDSQAAKDLVDSTMKMAQALQIPTTYGDLALSAFTLFKVAKQLSKINVQDVKTFAAQAKSLKNEVVNVSQSLKKYFTKNPAKAVNNLPCFNGKSFHSQAFSVKVAFQKCPTEVFKKFKVAIHLWNLRGQVFHVSDLAKFNNNYKDLALSLRKIPDFSIPIGLKRKILLTAANFKNNGVKIRAYGHPNFAGDGGNALNNYILHEINIVPRLQALGETTDNFIKGGNRYADFKAGNIELSKLWFNGEKTPKEMDTLLKQLGLVWHHSENLKSLQLIPTIVHDTLKPHSGGVAYVAIIRKFLNQGIDLTTIYFEIFIK